MMPGEHLLERVLLQGAATFHARGLAVGKGDATLEHLLVFADNQLELPVLHQLIAVFDHRGDLVRRVHMHQRKGDVPEERLAREPEQHGGILANAPQHGEVLELVERLAEDVDALILEFG